MGPSWAGGDQCRNTVSLGLKEGALQLWHSAPAKVIEILLIARLPFCVESSQHQRISFNP